MISAGGTNTRAIGTLLGLRLSLSRPNDTILEILCQVTWRIHTASVVVGGFGRVRGSFDPIFPEFFAERAPVDAQDLGRRGAVARALLEQ